ncbi:diacylglycerol kinase [Formosimonas limnophila]|uniref:Diacylglycerol kinase n=1 Tax=Formosimonas limnophila TaxID=1384487 RepID=A0A8J3CJA5_9BURK|nr:diacylglycerol kinase [Formosimonas limnophila]GHA79318.1 diacylglycerol kinase [Formosimonas limnophila]
MLSPKRIIKAFTYSMKGYKSALETESAFRDNLILVSLAQLICLLLQPAWFLWLLFLACHILLIVCELFNTAIEYLADQISLEHHDLLGRAKDVGSAAVFSALFLNAGTLAVIVWQFFQP